MPSKTDFNVSPYFDDYTEDKKRTNIKISFTRHYFPLLFKIQLLT